MTVLLTLTSAGADAGPFNIYSNSTGDFVLSESNISKAVLLAGYSTSVPDGTTAVRLQSTGDCKNYQDVLVDLAIVNFDPKTYRIRTKLDGTTTRQVECNGQTFTEYEETIRIELVDLDGVTPKTNDTGYPIAVALNSEQVTCGNNINNYSFIANILAGQSFTTITNTGTVDNCGKTECILSTSTVTCYTGVSISTGYILTPTTVFFNLCI